MLSGRLRCVSTLPPVLFGALTGRRCFGDDRDAGQPHHPLETGKRRIAIAELHTWMGSPRKTTLRHIVSYHRRPVWPNYEKKLNDPFDSHLIHIWSIPRSHCKPCLSQQVLLSFHIPCLLGALALQALEPQVTGTVTAVATVRVAICGNDVTIAAMTRWLLTQCHISIHKSGL